MPNGPKVGSGGSLSPRRRKSLVLAYSRHTRPSLKTQINDRYAHLDAYRPRLLSLLRDFLGQRAGAGACPKRGLRRTRWARHLLFFKLRAHPPRPPSPPRRAAEWNVCGWTAECRHTTAFPVGVGYLLGGEVSRLLGGSDRWVEVGVGFVPGLNGSGQGAVTERDGFVSFAGTLGLRRQPGARGAMYRVALTPLLTVVGSGSGFPDRGFMVYGGIALGYAF